MKLIPVTYNGFTAMDRRFSSPMLPWIVSEIRKREHGEKLSLGIEDGCLQAYDADFEMQFSHRVVQMTRFSQADLDPCTFLYLLRDDIEQLLYCYLFQASKQSDVSDLYQQMKEHNAASAGPVRSLSTASNLTSLCVDISPSSSNFFEVLYIGKIKVWHKKVPDTFIDDALQKFKQHDLDKNRRKLSRLRSEMDLRRGSVDSIGSNSSGEYTIVPKLQRSLSLLSNLSIKSPDIDRKIPKCIERITESSDDAENGSPAETPTDDVPEKQESDEIRQEPEESDLAKFERQLKLTGEKDDHNRTMVLQVDRTDLRLISPDRKVILLHKQHKDVTTCIQGITNSEHFGFIAREGSNINTYIGYVFKCESTSVTNEAVAGILALKILISEINDKRMPYLKAISQAFNNVDVKIPRPTIASCDHCPMVWFHKLCSEVENLTDRKTQAAIFRKIDQMEEDEQNLILTKFRGAETDSLREQNEFLMMLLRAHCEMKQGRHMHDSAESRSEFLNQYLGNSTIFMKAKRSLTNSFDHLLKRKPSKDDFAPILRDMTLPVNGGSREASPNSNGNDLPDNASEGFRSRSSTISSQDLRDSCMALKEVANKPSLSPERRISISDKTPKSPMMDIFFKVGSSPKIGMDPASWRQTIFKRVVTPGRTPKESRTLNKEELRALWKKAIYQAILLVRMEKENARIRAKQEESAVKRIKLEYDELRKQHGEIIEAWDMISNKDNKITCDNKMLSHAIRQGVPRGKRGEVWQFLAEQFCAKVPPIDLVKHPNYSVPYETLLKQLTSHQHAILIDLGRTFPAHSYFNSPLGPGQLALFNLLKAYSLLDPEVGYCQGLSFVAGVLLLHMEESQAFFLLRHLMYRRGLRQQYLPDMVGLQVKLYQLSRLLHDHLPDLYAHLDLHEVAPTLYAAPWLLTIFASQFPLGFVTRVFDLIFLENTDVIFRVVLALLTLHKESILSRDSFEDIMNYFKNKLPAIDDDMLERIMKEIHTMDISKQLTEYSVEYFVLQEEIQSVQLQLEAFQKLETQNRILSEHNKALLAQLEVTLVNLQRLEKNRAMQQSGVNKLETQVRAMEVTINTLGNFVGDLIESKVNVNIPGDVRRIASQISHVDRQRSDSKNSNIFNMFRKNENRIVNPNKLMVKSLSTGRIAFNNNNNNEIKKPTFFSNSNKEIIDQKLQTQIINQVNDNEKGRIMDDYIMECSEKSSPTNSIDSGMGTPVNHTSPTERFPTNSDKLNNNRVGEIHPLSNCDISCTYNTRELKKVKSIRDTSRNASPDAVN